MTKFTIIFQHNPYAGYEFLKKLFRVPAGHFWTKTYDSDFLLVVDSDGQLIDYQLKSNDKSGYEQYGKELDRCFDGLIFVGVKV